ncbi:hypothetical protein [Streptomyces sp. NPDC005955]|uniref:hypothetical protein n=1 Tax=Streptomyces sp. NPDC005955 TaxID=3364738 RepID=UPI0036BEDFB3
MGWGRSNQGPSEAFAAEEQARADGLARRCDEIASAPSHPMRNSLEHFQAAYRNASGNAAEHTAQPEVR